MKRLTIIPILTVLAISAAPVSASVIQTVSGTSLSGDPVSCRAELSITGDLLTVQLFNTSTQTLHPDGFLSSYFFDIADAQGHPPTLTYVSALGDVWLTSKKSADVLQMSNANLMALKPGSDTWQFRDLDSSLNPFLGFGIGTVGNSSMAPNNFNGNIVGGFDYSLYAGDVTTQNLNGYLLVKPSATFTFSGLSGFTEADIRPHGGFGLGTAPDSILWAPEPAGGVLMGLGALLLLWRRR